MIRKTVLFFLILFSLSFAYGDKDSSIRIEADICYPEYIYSSWSPCLDGIQSRTVTDSNSCLDEIKENRICIVSNNETENKFLNAKEINLEKHTSKKRTYEVNLESSYNEIFKLNNRLEDETFLVIDKSTGEEYLGKLEREEENLYFYSLERIGQKLYTELESEGLIFVSKNDGNEASNLLIFIMIILSIGLISFFVIRNIKKEIKSEK